MASVVLAACVYVCVCVYPAPVSMTQGNLKRSCKHTSTAEVAEVNNPNISPDNKMTAFIQMSFFLEKQHCGSDVLLVSVILGPGLALVPCTPDHCRPRPFGPLHRRQPGHPSTLDCCLNGTANLLPH